MLAIICIICLWLVMGASSFAYWWTSEFDLTCDEIPLMMASGLFGPLSFLGGWTIHGKFTICRNDKVLVRKR